MGYKSKEKQRRYQRSWRSRRRSEWLNENGPCQRCGASDELEVHHREPGRKVSHRVWSWTAKRRDAELAKCTVLCRGCHRAETSVQQRGERNVRAKLTRADVLAMYDLRDEGETQQTIAEQFGVHRGTVSKIFRGERWAHVAPERRAA